MNLPDAFTSLIEYALRGAPADERVHVYDFAAAFRQHVARADRKEIARIAGEAARVASSLRGAETIELQFKESLSGGKDGK